MTVAPPVKKHTIIPSQVVQDKSHSPAVLKGLSAAPRASSCESRMRSPRSQAR
jgi:hypothetical protein